jgi:selenide,water dikinase
LLVGFETSDDAAVYRLSPDTALISTVDYITPPVDDPYWFGQIAAANSLSDIYAMGGKPLVALNLVMFPSKQLDMGFLKEILHGGHDKVVEAGASLAGGHSVDDNEPKYGLAVTGVVHPERLLTNAGVKEEDALILTKPLGSGVLFNANRSKKLPWRELEQILYPNALEMYQKGETTGSNADNRRLAEGFFKINADLTSEQEELLFDPQTSGGLLLSVPSSQADDLMKELKAAGVDAASRVGEVVSSGNPSVTVV